MDHGAGAVYTTREPAVYTVKSGEIKTELQPHQQRVIDKLRASGGVLAAHGVGSGKTLEAIAAQDALGLPTDVVVPAPLVHNYEKEIEKHVRGNLPDTRIRSYEKTVQQGGIDRNRFVVADEAHRMRNPGTGVGELARQIGHAKARLLLTGTPVYNHPADLAQLMNAAAGREILPSDPQKFESQYVGKKEVAPGFFARLLGAKPASYPVLKNKDDLVKRVRGYVDVHPGGGPDFPSIEEREVDVPMSKSQHEVYRYLEGKLPWHLRKKVQMNLPLTKSESQSLNQFYAGMRQVSNSPRPYIGRMSHQEEIDAAPKLKAIVDRVKQLRQQDPNYRGVIYSNYLSAGLDPIAHQLARSHIPHALFTGEISKGQRKRIVHDYNDGKLPVLMVSGAGSEGLDLKGTKHIVLTEPHFNSSRLNQVIGRGARYKSHAHLPEAERRVLVERYFSTRPKPLIGKPDTAIERFLHTRSKEKDLLGKQVLEALQEASDYGPLHRRD